MNCSVCDPLQRTAREAQLQHGVCIGQRVPAKTEEDRLHAWWSLAAERVSEERRLAAVVVDCHTGSIERGEALRHGGHGVALTSEDQQETEWT